MWRTVRLATAVAIVVGGLAACEPPPPPIVIVVNSLAATRDANPGDGVCETAPGNGECTVAAAIDEGNAAGRAIIRVLDATVGEPELVADTMVITGDLTLFTDGYQNDDNAWFSELHVEPGAILRLENMLVISEHVLVEGTMLVDRSGLFADTTIAASGGLYALNSILWGHSDYSGPRPIFENHGMLWIRYSLVSKDVPVLHTSPGATTRIGASTFTETRDGACTGEPVESEGYNEDGNDCLNGPTDGVQGSDEIPVGELGCGTDIVVDIRGNPRPGTGGCTAGPDEG